MSKINVTLQAWVGTKYYPDYRDDPVKNAGYLQFFSAGEAWAPPHYVQVGIANIEIAPLEGKDCDAQAIAAIDEAIAATQAEFEAKINALRATRESLLALPAPSVRELEPEELAAAGGGYIGIVSW